MVSSQGPTQRAARLARRRPFAALVLMLALCYGVAALGGLSTAGAVATWYPSLDKPPWTPPNWAFGPIWSALYTLMAVGAWDVLRRAPSSPGLVLGLFLLQLALNALWSPLFFGLQWWWAGLAVMSALWWSILTCILVFAPTSRRGAVMYIPYLVWITIAWSLNAWVAAFNVSP